VARYDQYSERKRNALIEKLFSRYHHKLVLWTETFVKTNGKKILEIGSGRGQIANLLQKKGWSYKGYEPSLALWQKLSEQGFAVENKSVPPLTENDGEFDAIIMSQVLEHMSSLSDAETILAEARRVLSPSGILVITVPDYLDFGSWFWDVDATHQIPLTLQKTTELCKDQGFAIEKSGYTWGPFGYLPGHCISIFVKLLHAITTPFHPVLLQYKSYQKLQCSFRRSVVVIARK